MVYQVRLGKGSLLGLRGVPEKLHRNRVQKP